MIKYKACDFFMIRTPLLPIDDYLSAFRDQPEMSENLDRAFKNPILREALIVASKDLYEATEKVNLGDESKSANQIQSSLLKYFIRLSTRPTPFGLFSGIAMGKFDEISEQKMSNIVVSPPELHTKRARPDMEWVYGLIKEIESNSSIRHNLRVRFNDFTFVNGNRIEKPNKTSMQHGEEGKSNQEISTSIRYTDQVKKIEESCKDFRLFKDIINEVVSNNQDVPIGKIETFFTQLLNNEFLLSELRPPLTNTDMLEHIVKTLKNIEGVEEVNFYIEKIEEIRKSLKEYNSSIIGKGIDIYNNTTRQLKDLYENENYLQVDMKTHFDKNVLGVGLKSELNEFANMLYKVAPSGKKSEEMAHYFDLFVEKYGYGAEIPVMELLDVDKGLGSPSHYQVNTVARTVPKRQKTEKEQRLGLLMDRKLISALREGKRFIELTDEDAEYVQGTEAQNKENFPMDCLQSFELYMLAHPNSPEASFTILGASDLLGKTFGRFGDIFTEEETSILNKNLATHKKLLPDYIIAEITEPPTKGRMSNVSINNSEYDYQIALTTNTCEGKKSISIRDLYIGADRNSRQFYIKSKSFEKKVIVTMTSMLNSSFGSSALRFLREVSSMRNTNVISGFYGLINTNFEYYPRITYGRITLKPETWVISKDIIYNKSDKKKNKKDFLSSFMVYRQKWSIPRYVSLNEFDNKLLLDLDNPTHINEIYSTLKKKTAAPITLTELGCGFNEHVTVDEIGKNHVTEIVVPFVLSEEKKKSNKNEVQTKQNKPLKTQSDTSLNCMQIDRESLFVMPGDENWLYYKLYGCSKRQNELLARAFYELEKMTSENLVHKYFFIRYADPEHHIRLRVQAVDEKLPILFSYMNNWLKAIQIEGLISKAVIDTYQRETERYGGTDLIRQAEEYFFEDSKLVMSILKKQRLEGLSFSLDFIGMSFIISTLEAFGLSLADQQAILDAMGNNSSYRKEFQNNRKMFMRAVNSGDDWFEIRSSSMDSKVSDVYDLLNINSLAMQKYASSVFEADSQGKLTNQVKDIAFSIIHMFCNRLIGNNAWERKIYALARHGVHGLKGYLQHNQNNLVDLALPERLI